MLKRINLARTLSPTVRLTMAIVSLTVSMLLIAHFLGFIPDRAQHELEARQNIVEALAVQLTWSASRNDVTSLRATLDAVVSRNDEIKSAAVRKLDGRVIATAGDHEAEWEMPEDGLSTATNVHVPILSMGQPWGAVELTFLPLEG